MDCVEVRARLRLLFLALIAVSTIAPIAAQVPAQTDVPPRRTIRVVMDNDYAPFVFLSAEGVLQGILIDQWREWEKETGVQAEIHAMDWNEALRRMRAGEFDVIDTIVRTPERDSQFDFSQPYATVGGSIFFRNDISGITDLASLEGFPVGVKAGDQHIDRLRENGVTTVIVFRNYDEIVEAAKQGRINVFVADEPAALYLLHKTGIDRHFRHSPPIFMDQLRRAVRKGDAKPLQLVSEGFAAVDPDELKRIDEKWFGRSINTYRRYLEYAGYAAGAAFAIILALFAWNRSLGRKILQRTAALTESEQRFRQIAENIREVFWLLSTDSGVVLYASPAFEAVWGRSRDALYQNHGSFLTTVHPEDRQRVGDTMQNDRTRGFEIEYRIIRPDGEIRWIWDRGFPIQDERGIVYRLAGIAEDITDRKLAADTVRQAEGRIRLIIDTIPAMVWCLRPDGLTDFVNQRWLDYMGVSLESAIEWPLSTIHPDDVDRVVEKWGIDMAAGRPSEDEMRLRRADGQYCWFLIRTVPLRDAHGNIVSWYGSSTNIEDRKATEEKLRQSEDSLKATTEQLRALSARVQSAREEEGIRIAREIHDELGGSLTSLRWELEAVRKTVSEPGKAFPSSDLRDKLTEMLGLTDAMIDIVRRVASDLRPAVLDVLGLEEAIEWQARQFENRTGIAVRYESTGTDIELNPVQSTAVFRIFQEALTNVLRHARATRVDVMLVEDTGVFVLMIGDNGRGITESERKSEQSIGLLGMQERAHLIGGEIDVSGLEGEGTIVTLRLPLSSVLN